MRVLLGFGSFLDEEALFRGLEGRNNHLAGVPNEVLSSRCQHECALEVGGALGSSTEHEAPVDPTVVPRVLPADPLPNQRPRNRHELTRRRLPSRTGFPLTDLTQSAIKVGLRVVQPLEYRTVPTHELHTRHLHGPDVAELELVAAGLVDESTFSLHAVVQRRSLERGQHADHRPGNVEALHVLHHLIEAVQTVSIEAHNQSRRDKQATLTKLTNGDRRVHLLGHRHVLKLLRLAKSLHRGRLEASEDHQKPGLDHEVHQIRLCCDADVRFRVELEGVLVFHLPVTNCFQNRDRRLLVADEVVINDEDVAAVASDLDRCQLAQDLIRGLEPRTLPEELGHVAELAAVRTAPRALN